MATADFEKDPDDVLDYTVDWSAWLVAGDTISVSTFYPDAGLTANSSSNTSSKAAVWLSGGTQGVAYRVTNRITTTGGRTADRSFTVRVTAR